MWCEREDAGHKAAAPGGQRQGARSLAGVTSAPLLPQAPPGWLLVGEVEEAMPWPRFTTSVAKVLCLRVRHVQFGAKGSGRSPITSG